VRSAQFDACVMWFFGFFAHCGGANTVGYGGSLMCLP
jgi:hypothetical protein